MGIIFLAGENANTLERVISTPTASPGTDSNFGIARLYDRFPSSPFRFSSIATPSYVQVDQNLVTNGGMETASTSSTGDLETWQENASGGTGQLTQTAVAGEFSVGSAGMKLTAGTVAISGFQDMLMRSGERFTLTADLRSTGVTSTGGAAVNIKVRVRNMQTGNFLTTAGAWQTASADALYTSSSSFLTVTQTTTVESLTTTTKQDTVYLRVTVVNDNASTIGYADEVYMWPSFDFSSVHGHNIDQRVAATLVSSSSSGFGTTTTDATFTVNHPSFFSALSSAIDRRYVRLTLTGTQSTHSGVIYIGEWVLGQKYDPVNDPLNGVRVSLSDFQIRQDQNPTSARSILLGDHETRVVTMNFMHESTGNLTEYRDHFWRRSRFGHHPVVVCPISTGMDVVYGKLDPTVTYDHQTFVNVMTADINVIELPLPTFIA